MSEITNHPRELLPWYVNGTLEGDELKIVTEHLEQCGECKKEVELLTNIRKHIKEENLSTVSDIGLRKFKKQLQKEARGNISNTPSWFKPAMAAGLAVIILQSTIILEYSSDTTELPDDYIEYRSATDEDRHDGATLTVRFQPAAREMDIRRLLNDVGGQIVRGPTDSGEYSIVLGIKSENKEKLSAIIEILKENTQIVANVSGNQ